MNRRVSAAFSAATLLASTLTVVGAGPAVAAVPAAEAATLNAGLTALGGWLDDVGAFGDLASPLPLLDLAPGGADALDLAGHFGAGGPFLTAVDSAWASLGDGAGLEEFAAALSSQPGIDATAVALDVAGVGGLDVTLTHTVSVADAPLVVVDDTGVPVDLRSVVGEDVLGPGIPVELTLTAAFELRTDVDTGELWLVHRPTTDAVPTPSLAVDADVDGFDFPDPATDPFTSAIGIARVTLTDDSSLDLDARYAFALDDTDGDGRLAFMELAEDGVTAVPGELTLPLDQIVTGTPSGTVAADLGVAFDRIAVTGLSGTPRVTVAADLATGAPTIEVNADYSQLGSLLEIGATELLGGLGQLSLMLTGLQHRPSVDVDLPFLDVDVAEALPIAGDLAEFVRDHSLDDDEETLVNEFGTADFTTLDELVELLDAELPLVGDLAPAFDAGTDRLTMPVHVQQAPEAPEPITVQGIDGSTVPAGSIAFSESLPEHLGWLEGLSSSAGPVAQREFGYELAFTLGIDLQPATACSNDCDDPFTEEFIETEEPAIYERFLIGEAASGPEASVTAAISASVATLSGSIGFVTVEAQSGGLSLGSTTEPMLAIDLALDDTATAAPADLVPIYAVLRSFSATPLPGYTVVATPTATVPASLELILGVPMDGALMDLGGATTAGVTLTWADLTDGLTPSSTVPHGSLALLTGFALDPTDPNALLGVLLDHLGAIAGALAGFADGVPVLDDDIPFTTVRPKELLDGFDQLAQAITSVRGGVEPETLQELASALEGQLGSDVLDLSVADVGADGTPDLVVGLDLSHPIAEALPLGLDLSFGDLVGVGSTGGLQVDGAATVDLEFPIPISLAGLPSDPRDLPLSETSVVGVDVAGLLDHDVSVGVTLGGVDLSLGEGGQARVGFGLSASADDGDDADDGITTVGGFVDGLVAAGGPALTPAGGLTCETTQAGTAAVTGDLLCAAFPVRLGGAVLHGGDGTVNDDDLLRVSANGFDPAGWTVEPPTGLAGELANFALDLGSLPELVDRLATLLTAAMRLGGELPVVGEQLDAGADVVAQVQTQVRDAVDDALEVTGTVEDVRNHLESTLATTLAGSGILLPSDYDGDAADAPDVDDVRISLLDGDGNIFLDESTTDSLQIADVRVEFGLGQGDLTDLTSCAACTATLPLSTGLPALHIRTSGELQASYAWAIHLGFGVSRADGPYVLENPVPPIGGGAGDAGDALPELQLRTEAGMGAGDIAATLGVFEFTLSDELAAETAGADASGIDLALDANLNDPSGSGTDDRITLFELPAVASNPQAALQPAITFDTDLRLRLAATAGTGLPRVATVLDLEWQPFGSNPDPRIAFDGFEIALGSLFSETFGPILGEVRRLTEPVDPIREFLFSPLPVLSEVSRMFGGDDVTFVDLAELFGEKDLSLLEDINDVIEVVQAITNAGLSDDWIPIGDGFFVDGQRATTSEPTSSQAASLVTYTDPHGLANKTAPDDLRTQAQGKVNGDDALFDAGSGDDPADFAMPVIDDPSCLFGMLLGGDCVIIEWRPDPLELEFQYEQPFGPFFGVLYVTIGGYAGAGAKFGIGYDTHGARRLIEAGNSLSASSLGSAALDGVFLIDYDGPELYVRAGITAGAKLDVGIAEAGARGGIDAQVGFDLVDGPEVDGKLRIEEILTRIHNPLCLFDIVGALSAFLEVYVELGVCPLCVEKSFELARVVLLEFSEALAECDQAPLLAKTLTGAHPGTGEAGLPYVRLIMGPDAGERRTLTGVTAETFTVRELRAPVYDGPGGAADEPGLYSVTAFGHTQSADPTDDSLTYEGYWVDFDAGTDHDAVMFQGSKAGGDYGSQASTDPGEVPAFTAPVTGVLGDGDDVVTTGAGDDRIAAGPGTDQVTLLQGDDEAHGDTGVDTLLGGEGTDLLRGDADGDVIDGGPGDDDLDGGAGDDRVDGGRSIVLNDGTVVAADLEDDLSGGTGDDLLHGGDGDDTIWGDERGDEADLETGIATEVADATPHINDVIHGEDGDDTIYAGAGNDEVYGDVAETTAGPTAAACDADADDTVFGQHGDDVLDGGAGCDELRGGDDDDDLLGGPGHDQLFGDADVDTAWGGDGDDDVYGGTEDDELHGEAGADDIVGNAGGDRLFGDAGNDWLAGDDATAAAGGGFDPPIAPDDDDCATDCDDALDGGEGEDRLFGQGDVDTIRGGSDADQLHGNGGGDFLFGDRGSDTARGNAGVDTIEGGPDDDLLFGNSGGDTIHGQAGRDRIVGGSDEADTLAGATTDERDLLYGGADTDVLLGDNGAIGDVADVTTIVPLHEQAAGDFGGDLLDGGASRDRLHGQDGDDELYGGQGSDQLLGELGGDQLHGQGDADVMLGDRGEVTPAAAADVPGRRPSGSPATEGAPQWTVVLTDPDAGARDHLRGGSADDGGYGGAGDDLLEGGAGDDHLEGNNGRDELYGMSTTYETDANEALLVVLEGDEDDLIGGSSSVHPLLLSDAGASDEGELVMLGNAEQDVMVGDNADIAGVVAGGDPTAWAVDDVTGGRLREVTLHDRTRVGSDLGAVSGGDRMLGNGGADRMFGQGGHDVVKGNAGDDFVQGNQDGDLLEGNDGEDDLVGGTSLLTPAEDDGDRGDPDATDVLYGGGGADVLLGDNGVLTRTIDPAVTYTYVTTQLGIASQRGVTLFDLDEVDADRFGDDLLSGGAGVDVEFGQDGGDILSGGPADDYQEGNGGSDGLFGDRLPADPTLQADVTARGLTLPPLDAGVGDCVPPVVAAGPASCLSPEPELSGPADADGQDDQLGGSSRAGHRDAGDGIWGDGAADFQLGDNGELLRTIVSGAYLTYVEYNPETVVRQANRFDVGGDPSTHGADLLHGNAGDDYQWAQDGDDELHGDGDNDDMYGELGADLMFGGTGEDAMVGDRGDIADRVVVEGDEVAQASADTAGPAFLQILPLQPGDLDRRVDLLDDGDGDMDGDGDPVEAPGLLVGGPDRMFGGPDHDVVHGAFGDDLMNGEDGGDWLFGADGADVIWGGRGDADPANADDPGTTDGYIYGSFIDVIFGGHGAGGSGVEAADILDFRPRAQDPASWHQMTNTGDDNPLLPATIDNNQHHHGVDWIYGGFDRDVLQGNIGKNGPEVFGDRLIDWVGNFNLYTRCNASYGDDGDLRQRSPAAEEWLETLGFVTGVGASLADVRDPASSAYRQLAIVYKPDTQSNNGSAFPSTPGHFDQPSCLP